MKITFIGTGHGLPEKGRYRTAMMLEVGQDIYFIDVGAPIINEMLRLDKPFKNIKAVFVTHTHNDHMSAVIDMVDYISVTESGASIDFYLPEENVIDAIKHYITITSLAPNEKDARMHTYDESFVYEDENIRLAPFKTGHLKYRNRPSFGFVLECEGKRVVFSGDLSYLLEENDFPKAATECDSDAFICEMAHFDFELLSPYIEKCRTKAVYFNHIKHPTERIPLLMRENESGRFPFPIYAPSDGDVIEL